MNSAAAGEPGVVLDVEARELLDESIPAAEAISAVMRRARGRIIGQWRVTAAFRESGLSDDLLNSLVSDTPRVRAAAARLCGALRLSESVLWLADLVDDSDGAVSDAAIRALGQMGGWRAIQALVAGDRLSTTRLAITLSRGASDLDIEALIRASASEKAVVATMLACGLRGDPLRVPALTGVVDDRRWPNRARIAACLALGMIGEAATLDTLVRLSNTDPVPAVKAAAERARRKVLNAQVRRS